MTSMTPAFKRIQNYRDERNIDREMFMADDLSSCVYKYTDRNDRPCFVGYKGRSRKPTVNYYYSSIDARDIGAEKWMKVWADRKEEESKKQAEPRGVEVGDVFKSSWGYDQTNIDYYIVTALVGSHSVRLAELGQLKTHDDTHYGSCAPDVTRVVGESFVRRVKSQRVRITSSCGAWKITPKLVSGVKIYEKDSWTSYH